MNTFSHKRAFYHNFDYFLFCVEAKDLINVTVQEVGISAALTNASASRQIISVIADAIQALLVVINRLYKTYLGAQD